MNEQEMKELFERAKRGDASVLSHPQVAKAHDEDGFTALHRLAKAGVVEVLTHPEVGTVHSDDQLFTRTPLFDYVRAAWGESLLAALKHPDVAKVGSLQFKDSPLHVLAQRGVTQILTHPEVARARNHYGDTPLHVLAGWGFVEALAHPEVGTVKNNTRSTPLHVLASYGCADVICHPQAATVKDQAGRTPLHVLVEMGKSDARNRLKEIEAQASGMTHQQTLPDRSLRVLSQRPQKQEQER